MFVTEGFVQYADALLKCKDCLVIWPKSVTIKEEIKALHAIYYVEDPHNTFTRFFQKMILHTCRILMTLKL